MTSNYRYLKRIFLNVLSLIEVQMLGTNCQIKYVRYGTLQALNVQYPTCRTHFTSLGPIFTWLVSYYCIVNYVCY